MPNKKKKGATENVRVVVRLRPLSQAELAVDQGEVVRVGADRRSVQVLLPAEQDFAGNTRNTMKKFELDGCLDPSTSQEQTFEHSGVKDLLDAALDGFSATVFAYGQTGSGKTYTMAGPMDCDWDSYSPAAFDGVIPRSIRYIFQQIQAKEGTKYTIRASFLEIYNESVRDLWNPSSGTLSIREYPPGYWRGFYVEDLYIFECTDLDDMMFMLWEGMRHRAVGSHALNKDSSRSHSMLTFYLESEEEEDGDPFVKFGKISFVDLAGSERLKETQSGEYARDFHSTFKNRSSMKGDEMLKETGQINKSLFTLGKVIKALGDSKAAKGGSAAAFVPYRDSKLTKLLMDSLGGSSKALMFACCSPASSYLEETLNTLQYAMRTRNIKNKPAVQVDPHEELVRELRAEMKEMQVTNQQLRQLAERVQRVAGCPDEVIQILDDALESTGQVDGRASLQDQRYDEDPREEERYQRRAPLHGIDPYSQPREEQHDEGRTQRRAEPAPAPAPAPAPDPYAANDGQLPAEYYEDDMYGLGIEDQHSGGGAASSRRRTIDGPPSGRRQQQQQAGGGNPKGGRRHSAGRRRGDRDRGRDRGGRGRGKGGVQRSSASAAQATDGGFSLPALEMGLADTASGGGGGGSGRSHSRREGAGGRGANAKTQLSRTRGGPDDPLMPDSLTDGDGDWKAELDEAGRGAYKELGLALYNASSLDEMSAAMQGLQQFESRHKKAASGARAASGAGAGAAGSQQGQAEDGSFRQQALAFYKSDAAGGSSGFESAQKAALAAQLDRERKRAAAKEREQRLIQTF